MSQTPLIKKNVDLPLTSDYYNCSRPLGWQEPLVIIPLLGGDNQWFVELLLKRFPEVVLIRSASYTSNSEMIDNIYMGKTSVLVAKDWTDLPEPRLRVAINSCLGGKNKEAIPNDIYEDSGCSVYLRVRRKWREEDWMFGVEPFTSNKTLFKEVAIQKSLNKFEKRG